MNKRATSRSREASDVLVSQGWGRIAYNVVRSLARQGLKVVVGTDEFRGMSVFSRYVPATFRHPSFVTQTPEFVRAVTEALQRYSPKVYLPTNEDTYVAARYIDDLQATGVIVPVASFGTIKRLHNKNELMSLVKCLGIPAPETIVPRSESDIRAFCRAFGSPIVLKRISSSGARGVLYLTEDEIVREWNDRLGRRMFTTGVVLQQFVNGTGHGVSMLFNRGQLRAQFTHKRLREKPVTGGMSTVRMGVIHPALETYAERLLESVSFHGVAMVEFKYDHNTGQCWLLEVNPRFWGSLALAVQSGVDFPYLLYRMATEGDVLPVTRYRAGLVVKWLIGDIGASLIQWKRSSRWVSQGYDDFHWDDPLPFFGGNVLSLWKFLATRHLAPEELDLNIDQLNHSLPYTP